MYVVKYDRDPLLGREWINQLKILAKVKNSLVEVEDVEMLDAFGQKRLAELFKKYNNVVSEEFAHIKKYKAHLKLKPLIRDRYLLQIALYPLKFWKK